MLSAYPFSPIVSPEYQEDLIAAQAGDPVMMSGNN